MLLFDFELEARVLINGLAQREYSLLASQQIRTHASSSKSNIFVFMLLLRWPAFLTASTYTLVQQQTKQLPIPTFNLRCIVII